MRTKVTRSHMRLPDLITLCSVMLKLFKPSGYQKLLPQYCLVVWFSSYCYNFVGTILQLLPGRESILEKSNIKSALLEFGFLNRDVAERGWDLYLALEVARRRFQLMADRSFDNRHMVKCQFSMPSTEKYDQNRAKTLGLRVHKTLLFQHG